MQLSGTAVWSCVFAYRHTRNAGILRGNSARGLSLVHRAKGSGPWSSKHEGDGGPLPMHEDLRLFGKGGKIVCLESKHCPRTLGWDAALLKIQPETQTEAVMGTDLHSFTPAKVTEFIVHL